MSQYSYFFSRIGWLRLVTMLLAGVGAVAFSVVGIPLPFLFGPMFVCLVAALLGAPLKGVAQLSDCGRAVLGVAVGAAISPAVMQQVPQMAASVAFIPLYIAVIGLVGVPYFRKVCGFDLPTAYFSAMPGGLQDMVMFGKEAGGDPRALSLVHATRVLIIATIAPLVLIYFFGRSLDHPVGPPAIELPLWELGLMASAALAGWKVAARVGLFGAALLGPLIVTAALSLSGVIQNRPPSEAILGAQFFIGTAIGVGYVGITISELRKVVISGSVFVIILAVLAFMVTEAVVILGFASPVEGFLAFAPGGQAEMTVLAIVAGADLGFVVVHHLFRLIIVIMGAPLFAGLLGLRKSD